MAGAPDPGLCRTLCPLGLAPLGRWAVTAPWVLQAWLAHGCWAGSSILPARPTALLSPFAPVSHLLAMDLPFPLPAGRALRRLSGLPVSQSQLLRRGYLLLSFSADLHCSREARWLFADKQGDMGWKVVKSRQDFTQKSTPVAQVVWVGARWSWPQKVGWERGSWLPSAFPMCL